MNRRDSIAPPGQEGRLRRRRGGVVVHVRRNHRPPRRFASPLLARRGDARRNGGTFSATHYL